MTDLSELIERVRQATGPDRGLDIAIHSAISKPLPPGYVHVLVPRYTASLDAITALIEKKLPGRGNGYLPGYFGPGTWAGVIPHAIGEAVDLQKVSIAAGATPALALCLAFLLAFLSQDKSHEQ